MASKRAAAESAPELLDSETARCEEGPEVPRVPCPGGELCLGLAHSFSLPPEVAVSRAPEILLRERPPRLADRQAARWKRQSPGPLARSARPVEGVEDETPAGGEHASDFTKPCSPL